MGCCYLMVSVRPGCQRVFFLEFSLHPQLSVVSAHLPQRESLYFFASSIDKTAIAYYSEWGSWWEWDRVLCPFSLVSVLGPQRWQFLSVLASSLPPQMSAKFCLVWEKTCLEWEIPVQPPGARDLCFVSAQDLEPRGSLSRHSGRQGLLSLLLQRQWLSA